MTLSLWQIVLLILFCYFNIGYMFCGGTVNGLYTIFIWPLVFITRLLNKICTRKP